MSDPPPYIAVIRATRERLQELTRNRTQRSEPLVVVEAAVLSDVLLEVLEGQDKRVARAHIYAEISHVYQRHGEAAEAQRCMSLGLDHALESGDPGTLFSLLSSAGNLASNLGNYAEAVRWYQRSAPYAHTVGATGLCSTLHRIVLVYMSDPTTIVNAIPLLDWLIEIEPAPLTAMIYRYQCLIALGDTAAVQTDAKTREPETCELAGKIVAANLALRRWSKARKIAEIGLELAKQSSDDVWQMTFAGCLKS
jgi:hypothetical protein